MHCAAEKEQHKHGVFSKETKTQWKKALPKLAARGSRGESAGTRAAGQSRPGKLAAGGVSGAPRAPSATGSLLALGVAEEAGGG